MKLSKNFNFFILLWGLFSLFFLPAVFAEESQTTAGTSKIIILSPKPGEILHAGDDVLVTYHFTRGLRDNGNHVHVYLDGENEGTSKRSPRFLGKLSPGKHTILLKVSNIDHQWVNVEASVQFEVLTVSPR